MRRILLSVMMLCLLNSCGFEPIYAKSGSATSPAIADKFKAIQLNQHAGMLGLQLENAIHDQINPMSEPSPIGKVYHLEFDLKQAKTAAIVEQDGSIARYQVNFSSNYKLIDAKTLETLHKGVIRRVASYNVADEKFAAYIAEKDAAQRAIEEISADYAQRLAAYFASVK